MAPRSILKIPATPARWMLRSHGRLISPTTKDLALARKKSNLTSSPGNPDSPKSGNSFDSSPYRYRPPTPPKKRSTNHEMYGRSMLVQIEHEEKESSRKTQPHSARSRGPVCGRRHPSSPVKHRKRPVVNGKGRHVFNNFDSLPYRPPTPPKNWSTNHQKCGRSIRVDIEHEDVPMKDGVESDEEKESSRKTEPYFTRSRGPVLCARRNPPSPVKRRKRSVQLSAAK